MRRHSSQRCPLICGGIVSFGCIESVCVVLTTDKIDFSIENLDPIKSLPSHRHGSLFLPDVGGVAVGALQDGVVGGRLGVVVDGTYGSDWRQGGGIAVQLGNHRPGEFVQGHGTRDVGIPKIEVHRGRDVCGEDFGLGATVTARYNICNAI